LTRTNMHLDNIFQLQLPKDTTFVVSKESIHARSISPFSLRCFHLRSCEASPTLLP
jgi:hypothetical protein